MKKVLVVAPHPDDEILGVGATIAKHTKNGDDVEVVVVTRGSKDVYDDEYVEEGRKQEKEACSILGVRKISYLDFESPKMDTAIYIDVVGKIAEKVEEVKPDIVYIPHYGDMHFEHKKIAEMCMVALRPIEWKCIKIYGYEVLSETGWDVPNANNDFIPNVYEDVSGEYIEKKIDALKVFKSQMKKYPSARSIKAIRSLSEFRGAMVGVENAESFMLIREQRR